MLLWRQGTDLKRRTDWLASQTFVVLAMQIPKGNDKGPNSIEQFFAALHGIYREDPVVQEYVSFEIVAARESITFYVFTPLHLREFIESQLYAQYPNLEITQVPDYTSQADLENLTVATTTVQLTKNEVYPIKTYPEIDIDPLAGITAVMANLENNERVWLQLVIRPVGDEWHKAGISYVKDMRDGKDPDAPPPPDGPIRRTVGKAGRFIARVTREAIQPGTGIGDEEAKKDPPKLSAPQEAALKGIENKIQKLGFETVIRLTVISPNETLARGRMQSVLAALKQFNTTTSNGFTSGQVKINDFPSWQKYISREFEEKGKTFNTEELASLFHFPTIQVETSAISWSGAKKGEAPFNLPLKSEVDPENLTVLGLTDFRNKAEEFGIKLNDRKRHIYMIGKSGVGKSTLLENMIIDDLIENRGIIVVDPHGELADKIVESVPDHRINDVIYIDPADRDYPVAFNPLESVDETFKPTVASGFVGIFKKIFGYSWGPRLEYILRNTVLALLDMENPTMLGIPRMLTEAGFRAQVIPQIKDVVIKDFWTNEFAGWTDQQRNEAVAPILNKVGQFLSSNMIRNIVGQPESTFDFRQAMDQQKIVIVNLSKGKIGEDNMALLGSMIITKVQLAAMSRADVAASERPDCFLYVDEFQNFATESFATILSEARKYGLGLTIAHQYIAQMSEEVKDAVIGNVGTIITFRTGAPDASALEQEFAPVFSSEDIVNLPMARIYIKLLVDGITAPAFSAQTLPPRQMGYNNRDAVVAQSRATYARTREMTENIIDETAGYRQKREQEEARNQASSLLQQAPPPQRPNATLGGAPRPLPKDGTFQTAQAPQPASQPVVNQEVLLPEAPNEATEQKPKKPQVEKPLRLMNKISYKEVSQKGGQKWFIGEPEADAIARREKRKLAGQGSETEKMDEHPEDGDNLPMVKAEIQLPVEAPHHDMQTMMINEPAPLPVTFEPPAPLASSPEHMPNTGEAPQSPPVPPAAGAGDSITLKEGEEWKF